ncbi:hypothetical protein I4641_13615 [Waterburya agarophytonicola K14]|uniref:Uncharacterized protein n=1 Tax=Waterburya agarophytonicola KI4 TaxID=2874699 RepID=A0A964FGB0_9CYAN|nr:hypothetical protein [Waterburya agarophytonicola]MCC0178017.1 hypothetical protein [Waterburya agarophytonicola KI4]
MRSRARRRNNQINQNLDSFLDVLTNTVGVLMFISLFVTLIATGGSSKAKITIETPLSSDTDKESLWFEIKDNKVSHLDLRQVREKELELSGNLPNCNKPLSSIDSPDYAFRQDSYQSCLLSIVGRQSNFRATTQNYNVRTVDEGVSLLFNPISEDVGENTSQLIAADSQFKQVLAKYNAQKDYLIFIVRPDSFEAFREARKQAWAAGYEVGWEPHPQDAPIKIRTILGSELPGGKSIGVQ